MNVVEKFEGLNEIPEDRILPENIDHYQVWKDYVEADPGAICGGLEFRSIEECRQINSFLYKAMGALNYLNPWGRILDVGAGYGSLRLLLNQYHDYVPVDVFPFIPDSTIVSGDGQLPFPDQSFDYVYCSNVMQHIYSSIKEKYISEFYRILKVNGKAFISFQVDDYKLPPRFNNTRYAVTGDYFVPLNTGQEIDTMINKVGFQNLIKCKRPDDFTSWWCLKNENVVS